jgi:hypothetical protein
METSTQPTMGGSSTIDSSGRTPRSMLGFMYRGTYFPNFRQAAWDDIQQMVGWFGAADNAAFAAACQKVDHASYLMRRYTNDVAAKQATDQAMVSAALADLNKYVPVMFEESLTQVERAVERGELDSFEGLPLLPNHTTLSLAFAVVYYPEYRRRLLDDQAFAVGTCRQAADCDVGEETFQALRLLAAHLEDNVATDELSRTLRVISATLAREFETVGWKICW